MGEAKRIIWGWSVIYNAHGHKLRFPAFEKPQFVTALGIISELKLVYICFVKMLLIRAGSNIDLIEENL